MVDGRLHRCLDGYYAAIDHRVDRLKSCRGTRRYESHAAVGVSVHARRGHIIVSDEPPLQMRSSTRCDETNEALPLGRKENPTASRHAAHLHHPGRILF